MCGRKTLQMANTLSASELEKQLSTQLLAVEQRSLSDRINAMLSQNCGSFPSQQAMARQLNLSTRTLRRQLSKEQTSYQALLNGWRHKLAIKQLADNELSILEIADNLGFSSASHFSYAFKQWQGMAPQYYRHKITERL